MDSKQIKADNVLEEFVCQPRTAGDKPNLSWLLQRLTAALSTSCNLVMCITLLESN